MTVNNNDLTYNDDDDIENGTNECDNESYLLIDICVDDNSGYLKDSKKEYFMKVTRAIVLHQMVRN